MIQRQTYKEKSFTLNLSIHDGFIWKLLTESLSTLADKSNLWFFL